MTAKSSLKPPFKSSALYFYILEIGHHMVILAFKRWKLTSMVDLCSCLVISYARLIQRPFHLYWESKASLMVCDIVHEQAEAPADLDKPAQTPSIRSDLTGSTNIYLSSGNIDTSGLDHKSNVSCPASSASKIKIAS